MEMLILIVVWAAAVAMKPTAKLRPRASLLNFIQVSWVAKGVACCSERIPGKLSYNFELCGQRRLDGIRVFANVFADDGFEALIGRQAQAARAPTRCRPARSPRSS